MKGSKLRQKKSKIQKHPIENAAEKKTLRKSDRYYFPGAWSTLGNTLYDKLQQILAGIITFTTN